MLRRVEQPRSYDPFNPHAHNATSPPPTPVSRRGCGSPRPASGGSGYGALCDSNVSENASTPRRGRRGLSPTPHPDVPCCRRVGQYRAAHAVSNVMAEDGVFVGPPTPRSARRMLPHIPAAGCALNRLTPRESHREGGIKMTPSRHHTSPAVVERRVRVSSLRTGLLNGAHASPMRGGDHNTAQKHRASSLRPAEQIAERTGCVAAAAGCRAVSASPMRNETRARDVGVGHGMRPLRRQQSSMEPRPLTPRELLKERQEKQVPLNPLAALPQMWHQQQRRLPLCANGTVRGRSPAPVTPVTPFASPLTLSPAPPRHARSPSEVIVPRAFSAAVMHPHARQHRYCSPSPLPTSRAAPVLMPIPTRA